MSKKPRKTRKVQHVQRKNITRYSAQVRSPIGEWWVDHRKQIKITSIVVGGVIFVIYLAYEFFKLFF